MEEGFLWTPKFCTMSGKAWRYGWRSFDRGSEGSLGLLVFSRLELSAIENCSHLIGPVI